MMRRHNDARYFSVDAFAVKKEAAPSIETAAENDVGAEDDQMRLAHFAADGAAPRHLISKCRKYLSPSRVVYSRSFSQPEGQDSSALTCR